LKFEIGEVKVFEWPLKTRFEEKGVEPPRFRRMRSKTEEHLSGIGILKAPIVIESSDKDG